MAIHYVEDNSGIESTGWYVNILMLCIGMTLKVIGIHIINRHISHVFVIIYFNININHIIELVIYTTSNT